MSKLPSSNGSSSPAAIAKVTRLLIRSCARAGGRPRRFPRTGRTPSPGRRSWPVARSACPARSRTRRPASRGGLRGTRRCPKQRIACGVRREVLAHVGRLDRPRRRARVGIPFGALDRVAPWTAVIGLPPGEMDPDAGRDRGIDAGWIRAFDLRTDTLPRRVGCHQSWAVLGASADVTCGRHAPGSRVSAPDDDVDQLPAARDHAVRCTTSEDGRDLGLLCAAASICSSVASASTTIRSRSLPLT